MEANRIWHEPVIEVYSNLITPGVCCSAAAYDLANRRWYQLNVGDAASGTNWHHDTRLDEVPDDEWLGSTVEKYIKEHYHSTATLPPWNKSWISLAGYRSSPGAASSMGISVIGTSSLHSPNQQLQDCS